MPKVNYTKVEEAVTQGLHKMNVQRLLALADKAESEEGEEHASKEMLQLFQAEIKRLRKKDNKFHEKLGFAEGELNKILEHPEELTPEDWKKIGEIRKKISSHARELKKQLPPGPDDDTIIEEQRKEHEHKRYNVKDDWFPI